MEQRYHISTLGKHGAGITTDVAGYVHMTADGWLAAPMDAADGPLTREQAEELARESRAATEEAEAAVAAWQGGGLAWHQMPDDAGQSVDVEYAVEWIGGGDGWVYRREHDRSDGSRSVQRAAIADGGGEFAPWNGVLPEHGDWQDVG